MRSFLRFTMAIALLVPLGVVSAMPAGAAGGTTCKAQAGNDTITPGLGVTKKAQSIVAISTIRLCTGGGVTGGAGKSTVKLKPVGCAGLATLGTKSTITQTVTWNTKKTSTMSGTFTTGPKAGQGTITVTVTAGLFKGMHGSTVLAFGSVKGGGLCTDASPLKKLTFKILKPFVIT